MRVKLKFPTKSEAARLLGQRLEDPSMPHDLFLEYFKVYEDFTSRKRQPGWAEKLCERVERLEKAFKRRILVELESDNPELRRSLEQ